MKTTRQTLRNGVLRGGIVLGFAYLLALQALLAGLAQGSWAAASADPLADPLHVICSANGITVLGPAGGKDGDTPGDDALRWHCATLCQLAAGATPAVLGARTGYVAAPRQQALAVAVAPSNAPQAALTEFIAEARAPPSSI